MTATEQKNPNVRNHSDDTEDRRVARTKKLIKKALMELMHNRPYEQITVQDIIDKADIGRTTFYTHYQDKDELVTQFFEEMMEDLTKGVKPESGGSGPVFPIAEMFSHLKDQNAAHGAWLGSRGREFLFSVGQKYWYKRLERDLKSHAPKDHGPRVPITVIAQVVVGGATSLLHWWMNNKMPYSPEEMQTMFNQLLLPGIRLALGAGHKGSASQ